MEKEFSSLFLTSKAKFLEIIKKFLSKSQIREAKNEIKEQFQELILQVTDNNDKKKIQSIEFDCKLALEYSIRKAMKNLADEFWEKFSPISKPNDDMEVVGGSNSKESQILEHISGLFDLTIDLSLKNPDKQTLVDPSVPPLIAEELFQLQTIEASEVLFSILEKKTLQLSRLVEGDSKPKLTLLKFCIELLRRLSKSSNSSFCGRIILFIGSFLPLPDRSGLNLRSEINQHHLAIDSTQNENIEIQDNHDILEFDFYKTLWSLQKFTSQPDLLTQDLSWLEFIDSLSKVIEKFNTESVNTDDNLKIQESPFFNYLTSSKLTKLQIKDSTFRRHILVQILILIHTLQNPISKPITPQFDEKKIQKLQEFQNQIFKLLDETKPLGKNFSQSIKNLIDLENHWISWKSNECPNYEKSEFNSTVQVKELPILRQEKKMLNPELARLWNQSTEPRSDIIRPSLEEYLEPVKMEMDPKNGIEEEYKQKNNKVYCWKTFRLISREKLIYFKDISNPADSTTNLEGVVTALERDKNIIEVDDKNELEKDEKEQESDEDDSKQEKESQLENETIQDEEQPIQNEESRHSNQDEEQPIQDEESRHSNQDEESRHSIQIEEKAIQDEESRHSIQVEEESKQGNESQDEKTNEKKLEEKDKKGEKIKKSHTKKRKIESDDDIDDDDDKMKIEEKNSPKKTDTDQKQKKLNEKDKEDLKSPNISKEN